MFVYRGGWRGRQGSSGCSWEPFRGDTAVDETQGVEAITKVVGGVRYTLFERDCPGSGTSLHWIGPPSISRVRGVAWDELAELLPAPSPASAPPASEAYVGVPTWFWTSTEWSPISVSAWVPTEHDATVWATTTATPVRLVLDPGDGSAPVECSGPGLAWTPAAGDDAVSACSHEFLHTSLLAANSQSYPATMSIEWEVAWTGSTGSGSLPGITTRRSLSFVVGEIQAVVSG
ncbi:MAG: hypothetical protein R2705_05735 [Ilumatobacteraceae bacterium]